MTVYGVRGQWLGTLTIEGTPVKIDTHQIFREITIRQHIHMDLPSLTLHFMDVGGELVNRLKIRDGMRVTCGMGDGIGQMPPPAEWLLLGGPQTAPGPGADEVMQKALLAHPAWPRKIWDQAVMGTSDNVISQIAQAAGLRPEVHTADDLQKWLPNNRPLAQYARFLAERAWFGEQSAPIQGIRENSTYVYKDIEKLIAEPPVGLPIGMGKGQLNYLEHMFTSKAKVYNSVRGYGSTSILDDGTGKIQEFGQIAAGLLSGSSGIGDLWSKAVGSLGTRVEWSPIDAGNVHKNYHKAKHHNPRIKGLYGEDVKVLFDRQTNMELLQMVQLYPWDRHTQSVIEAYAGKYMVTGKVRMLRANRYYELLTLTTNSNNE